MADIFNMVDTWNAGGTTFTAIKMNVTDTASAAASLLMDLQVGGVSMFNVTKAGTVFAPAFRRDANVGLSTLANRIYFHVGAGVTNFAMTNSSGLATVSGGFFGWSSSSTDANIAADTSLYRIAAAITGVRGANNTSGGALSFIEQTAPSAPATNGCYIYAQDNGASKTQLMALFATGAAQQIAIEP